MDSFINWISAFNAKPCLGVHTITTLNDSYAYCKQITRKAARNFYFAFMTLPVAKRNAIFATYAFCRTADDIVDQPAPANQQIKQLQSMRQEVENTYKGAPRGPIYTALEDVVNHYKIPQDYFLEILSGMEMDLTINRYATFDNLYIYCYKVAAVVGLICLEIFGYEDAEAKQAAVNLGVGMQMTNIMRDIKEDAQIGRIYLPQDELSQFGYTENDLQNDINNENFRSLMHFQAERTRDYLSEGRRLIYLLSRGSRTCPAVLYGLYSKILDRMESKGFNVFDGRTSLSNQEKLILTLKVWLSNSLPRPRMD